MSIVKNMPADEYFAAPGVSNSMLKHLARSPSHFQHYLKEGQKETEAMRDGTMIHFAVLQPEIFKAKYCFAPKFDKRTSAGKQGFAEFEKANEGKIVMEAEKESMVAGMANSICDHPFASKLLGKGAAEQSLFSVHEESGVLRKCRPDWITGNACVDLKSCENASPKEFERTIGKYGYHVQGSYYDSIINDLGMGVDYFFFIAAEKSAPFGVSVFELQGESLKAGRRRWEPLLATYALCETTGRWPAYSDDKVNIDAPVYSLLED